MYKNSCIKKPDSRKKIVLNTSKYSISLYFSKIISPRKFVTLFSKSLIMFSSDRSKYNEKLLKTLFLSNFKHSSLKKCSKFKSLFYFLSSSSIVSIAIIASSYYFKVFMLITEMSKLNVAIFRF